MERATSFIVKYFAGAVIAAVVLSACGGNDSANDHPGKAIARSNGCAACHGSDGQGQVGPAFVGLFGSEVTLEDGSVVTADAEYLRRSVTDPDAQVVDGYNLPMPTTKLTDAEIDQIVAYIESLADEAP